MHPHCYIMTNKRNGTLYIGVTSDLVRRVSEHQRGLTGGFTQQYGAHQLIWFEEHPTMESAIAKEKQMKKWNRAWKVRLIESVNPNWDDLSASIGAFSSQSAQPRNLDSRLRGNDEAGVL